MIWMFTVFCVGYTLQGQTSQEKPFKSKYTHKKENAVDPNHDYERFKNPMTGNIPEGIKELALKFSETIEIGEDFGKSIEAAKTAKFKSNKGSNYSYWKNRGPYNLRGRTQALAIDVINENVLFSGSASGGLWRSTNGGESWRNRPYQNKLLV